MKAALGAWCVCRWSHDEARASVPFPQILDAYVFEGYAANA